MSHHQEQIKRITSDIGRAFGPDRRSFRRELNRIIKRLKKLDAEEKASPAISRLTQRVSRSIEKRGRRKRSRPRLSFPPALPITAHKEDIVRAISKHRVVIIAGETGSGKTTQIPKMCLAAGRGIDGKIGCTQPRRIAAVSVANRIAEELTENLGQSVGYKIRFQDKTSPEAFIKIMTDGILLAETQNDPWLSEYDTLIVDEAHERSLNIDFLLGFLKTLVERRKDLKLIITSATIDTEKFSKAFGNAPIIEVSGRMYPVEVRWGDDAGASDEEKSYVDKAVTAVEDICTESRSGDILVFMPTEQDIRETIELLAGRRWDGVFLLPLFARLTAADQTKVFASRAGRKIIVATNIAETSLTIPGIKYVVDTGLARISQYSPRTRITALPVSPISKSSADQRMGRCGRIENGVCVRLFSEKDYRTRPRFTKAEILRANLAEVILRMIALGLPHIEAFPFVDRPAEKSVRDGFDLLEELGAIKHDHGRSGQKKPVFSLSEDGRQMAALPLDPRLSRMLIEAKKEGCLQEIAVIVSALSIQDPRERPAEKEGEADQAHAAFSEPLSDFITLLNIWRAFQSIAPGAGSAGRLKKFCKTHFLSFRRMREWRDIYGQVTAILAERRWIQKGGGRKEKVVVAGSMKAPKGELHPLYVSIHKAILSGFLSNIACRKEGNVYRAAKDKEVMVFPGSGLFNRGTAWIVAAEMVETTRLYARTAAMIDPEWIAPLAKDRCRYTYLDPHWEKNRGQVVATEQVSLYGLIVQTGRKIAYGPKAPEQATDIFIQEALVNGDVKRSFPFIRHNRKLMQEVQRIEDRIRRRDVLLNEEELCLFYRQHLAQVYDVRTLSAKIRKAGGDEWLYMQKSDLVRYMPTASEMKQFPTRITLGKQSFPCHYHFDPESERDGLTVKIPSAATPQLSDSLLDELDWMVPGLYEEKIAALLKGLPKSFRRQLSPVSQTATVIAAEMPQKTQGLLPALSAFIHKRFGLVIPKGAWPNELPDYLRMRISVTDAKGKEIAAARDRSVLYRKPSQSTSANEFDRLKKKHEIDDVKKWDFGDLPETMVLKGKRRQTLNAYPALVADADDPGKVHYRLFQQPLAARRVHPQGVKRLYCRHFAKDLKHLKKNLGLPKRVASMAAYVGGLEALQTGIYTAVVNELFTKDIRKQSDFFSHAETIKPFIQQEGRDRLNAALTVIQAVHETRTVLHDIETKNKSNQPVRDLTGEIRSHLARLIPQTFVALYDMVRLEELPRLVKAMAVRAQKGAYDPQRDQKSNEKVAPYVQKLQFLLEGLGPEDSDDKRKAVEDYFWMLEEFKISVFAQEIKTAFPISPKRLDKQLAEIEAIF